MKHSSSKGNKIGIIVGVTPVACIFCEFMTSIEFDLDLHLYEQHRIELVKLPVGRGSINKRIEYAIEDGRRIGNIITDQEIREKLGFFSNSEDKNDIINSQPTKVVDGVDFILSHFSEPLFPRRIMTREFGIQVPVCDRQSIIIQFQTSRYEDCRINAYSYVKCEKMEFYLKENRDAKNALVILFIDLDLRDFNFSKDKLDQQLEKTLKKIKDVIGGHPTVLDTGNGYHIYQPVMEVILEDIDILSRFADPADNNHLINRFMEFAEQYFTDGKSDQCHHPTVGSCLLRVPGTTNSKCGEQVKIVQEWNEIRPSIRPLLHDFAEYLTSKGQENSSIVAKNSTVSVQDSDQQKRYAWVEKLLNIPIGDYRRNAVWLILARYLIVIKELSFDESFTIIKNWLDKCDLVEPLKFNSKQYIKSQLKNAQRTKYQPISFRRLQKENRNLYNKIRYNMQQ